MHVPGVGRFHCIRMRRVEKSHVHTLGQSGDKAITTQAWHLFILGYDALFRVLLER